MLDVAFASGDNDPGEYTSSVVLSLNPIQRSSLKGLVATSSAAATLLDEIRVRVESVQKKPPEALAEIHYEGLINTDPQRIRSVSVLRRINEAADRFSLWQATDDPKMASLLRETILTWALTYRPTGNDVNEYKLLPIFVAYKDLRETFSDDARNEVDSWIEELGTKHNKAVQTSEHFTNRYTKHLRLLSVFAETLGRDDWMTEVWSGAKRFVTHGLRPDGSSLDLERRDTLTYHSSGLRPLLQWLIPAPEAERAFYKWTSSGGCSLQRSVDFVVPYASGDKSREEWRKSRVDLDRRRAAAGLSEYLPGRRYEPTQALPLLQEASRFDPTLIHLIRQLSGNADYDFANWVLVLSEACHRAEMEASAIGQTRV